MLPGGKGKCAGAGAVWDPRGWLGRHWGATAQSGASCSAAGEPQKWGCPRPQAERSGPLSSVLELPEGSSLQWAGAAPQLTVSYLWF